jgi:hypothetical protein
MEHWSINFAFFLALFVFMDWAFPARMRLLANPFFKRDEAEFYALIRRGYLARLATAIVLAVVVASVIEAHLQEEAEGLTVVGIVVIYGLIVSYAVWRAR